MADSYTLAGEGSLFAQVNGPNTKPAYLGCHQLGDVAEPMGDVEPITLKSPIMVNAWDTIGAMQKGPGLVGTSIAAYRRKTRDWLEKVKCPLPIYIMHNSCGRPDGFNNWDIMWVMEETYITNRGATGLTARTADDQTKSELTFDLSAVKMLKVWELTATRVATPETDAMNDIFECVAEQCPGDCGDAVHHGSALYGAGRPQVGSPVNTADISIIYDSGASIVFASSDPFAAAEAIASIRCFEYSVGVTRIIVARGTADAGNPMEIAYSDNGGLTWTYVNVGSTLNQYAIGPQSLYIVDSFNIWLVTTGGYIYKSEDGGGSWVAKSSGSLTVQNLHGVTFYGEKYGLAFGANNTILKTIDGNVWSVVTGPAGQAAVTVNTGGVLSKYRLWIGFNDGKLYYSHNGGTTWTRRQGWQGDGTGSIVRMDWYDMFFGAFCWDDATGYGWVFVTLDGGYNWRRIATPTNVGLNSLIIVEPTEIWAVGEVQGGTAVVLKIAAD